MEEEKETTLESLARMVQKGFEGVHEEISEIRGEISEIRGEISEIRGEISGVHEEIFGIRKEISGIHGKIFSIHGDISSIRTEMEKGFDEIQAKFHNHPTHADLERELQKYHYAKEIDEIRGRVGICEEKLGITD